MDNHFGFLALIVTICALIPGGHIWSAANILISNRKGQLK